MQAIVKNWRLLFQPRPDANARATSTEPLADPRLTRTRTVLATMQRPLGSRARRFLSHNRDMDGGLIALRDFDRLLALADELAAAATDDPASILTSSAVSAYRAARGWVK